MRGMFQMAGAIDFQRLGACQCASSNLCSVSRVNARFVCELDTSISASGFTLEASIMRSASRNSSSALSGRFVSL